MLSVLSRSRTPLVALAPLIVACGSEPESLQVGHHAIYEGVPSGVEDDAVVFLQSTTSSGALLRCVATLVAPNLVVTARHCVAEFNSGSFECDAAGELISGSAGKILADLAPERVEAFAGATLGGAPAVAIGSRILSTGTPHACRDDLAFVVLDRSVDLPTRAIRVFDPILVGEPTTVIGYGAETGSSGRTRVSALPVLSVGPDEYDPEDTSLTPPRSFALGRSICLGDSGAPAISDETGAVLGVASLSVGPCASPDVQNLFPQIRAHRALVRDAFEAAGAEPEYEHTPGEGEESESCQLAVRPSAPAASWLFALLCALALKSRRSTCRTRSGSL